MSYQSFDAGVGSSDSHGKLAALKLPDLSSLTVLDLGCNAGFFCKAALELGARQVTGVDRDAEMIAEAQRRVADPRAKFVNSTWDALPEGSYDLILLLSALHYASDQEEFLSRIARMLTPDGLLVLECGIADRARTDWMSIMRGKPPHTDVVEYPSRQKLLEILSEHYAVRLVGPSVLQPGDMIPRFVFHCRKLKQTVLCIAGPSQSGKSTLRLAMDAEYGIEIDKVVLEIKDCASGQLAAVIRQSYEVGRIDRCYEEILANGLERALAEEIVGRFPQWRGGHGVALGRSLLKVRFLTMLAFSTHFGPLVGKE